MHGELTERPAPDYRDLLEIAIGGDDDDSGGGKPKKPARELEERVLH
jgi:hypothetical protein